MKNFKIMTNVLKRHPIVILYIIICLVIPIFLKSQYYLRILNEMFFYAALGAAWNILGGFGRQISWCSASFFTIGAYTTMLFFIKGGGISPWLTIWIGMAIAGVLAVIIGLPSFRLHGVFFSIATISFASIIRQLIYVFTPLTGGSQGLKFNIRSENNFWELSLLSESSWYYVAFFLMLIMVGVTVLVNRSKIGYYLKAIREDEDAATSLGIRAHRLKLLAFIISAMMIAAVGTFYGFKFSYIDPTSVASHDMSIRIGVTAIIGGIGSVWGPVVGAIIVVPGIEIANYYLSTLGHGGGGLALYGLAMILVTLLKPNGLISIYQDVKERIRTRRKTAGKIDKGGA
jgi:branched-chain amino acid transport system permease protein